MKKRSFDAVSPYAIPALVALLLTLVVRSPFVRWPLTVDEGGYAYTARWWFRGLTLYSDQLWFDRPQAIFLVYAAGMRLIGESTSAIRVWGALWAAATSYGCFLITELLSDRKAAWVSLVLSVAVGTAPYVEGFTANAETFMLVPAIFAAYCLLRRRWMWAGLLGSLAALLKPSGIVAILLGIIWLAYNRCKWREWLSFAGASAPLPLFSIIHAAMTVGLRPYLDAVLWYRLGVDIASGFQPESPAIVGWLLTFSVWAPLVAFTVAGVMQLQGRERVFALSLLSTSLLGVAMGAHWLMHYFLQLVIPLAIVAGVGLRFVAEHRSAVIRAVFVPVLAAGLVLFGTVNVSDALLPPLTGIDRLYHRPGYLVSNQVASYLRAHADPEDQLYVAFYQAEIYYLSGLRSSTKYLYRLDLDRVHGAFSSVVSDISARRPRYVLDLQQPLDPINDTRIFESALLSGYRQEQSFGPFVLYVRRSPHQQSTEDKDHPSHDLQ